MNYKNLITLFLLLLTLQAVTQNPHILVDSSDKQAVWTKINQQPWAKSIFEEMKKDVDEYVNRSAMDFEPLPDEPHSGETVHARLFRRIGATIG
jgi:hypothetical protein